MKKLLVLPGIISLQIVFAQNVGIGTNNPATLLHVFNGDLLVRGNSRTYYLTDAGTAFNNSIITADQSSIGGHAGILIKGNNPFNNYPNLSFSLQNSNARTILGGAITGIITGYSAGEETMDIQFSAKPPGGQITEYLRITSAGNVGIGTTTPGEKLAIVSSDNNSVTNISAFYPNNLTQGIGIGFDEIRKIGTNANSNLYINAKGSGNLILQNSATGNVGIGVVPEQNLSIKYGMNIDQGNGNNGTLDNNVLRFGGGGSGEAITSPRTGGSNNQYGLDFYTASAKRMVITSGGNVGIGTSTPSFKLDVGGRMRIRSEGGSATAGLYLNTNDNSNLAAFIGMDDDTHVGFWGSGVGWKFTMNTQTGALKVNGSEGTAGQVITSAGSGQPSWDFPIKTYQWGLPGYTFTTTETSIFNQNVTATINSSFIISIQITLSGSGLGPSKGEAYLYIDGVKSSHIELKVDGNYSYESVVSLPNFIFNGGPGNHSLDIRVLKDATSNNLFLLTQIGGVPVSYVSVVQITR